jgi:hypothetical protein
MKTLLLLSGYLQAPQLQVLREIKYIKTGLQNNLYSCNTGQPWVRLKGQSTQKLQKYWHWLYVYQLYLFHY